ncbi:MAG: DUF2726 domain-containing protein [Planctomycetota bacterium]|nr:MAG: DUF2726 domain-containing protein [Planctomycetota bacterium]
MANWVLVVVGLVVVVGVVLVVGVAIAVAMARQQGGGGGDEPGGDVAGGAEGPLPYEAKRGLLTDAELRFFATLEPAVAAVFGPEARIAFQVPVGAVVQPRRGLERGERQKWRNKVDRKTFDFVIIDARTRVLACVELDDSSHGQQRRRERDAFLERVCAAAGVRLVRVEGRQRYELEGVAGVLAKEV